MPTSPVTGWLAISVGISSQNPVLIHQQSQRNVGKHMMERAQKNSNAAICWVPRPVLGAAIGPTAPAMSSLSPKSYAMHSQCPYTGRIRQQRHAPFHPTSKRVRTWHKSPRNWESQDHLRDFVPRISFHFLESSTPKRQAGTPRPALIRSHIVMHRHQKSRPHKRSQTYLYRKRMSGGYITYILFGTLVVRCGL